MCDVDSIIQRLLEARKFAKHRRIKTIKTEEIHSLIRASIEVISNESMLLYLQSPLKVVSDIRGYYYKLLHIFDTWGYPPEQRYLFLGNYVCKGPQEIETIVLLLALKVKYPDKIFLLRGQLEQDMNSRIYGFYHECKERYNVRTWRNFLDLFHYLPVAAVVDKRIFCVHGGLSPELESLDQIRNVPQPTNIEDTGLLSHLLLSYLKLNLTGWKGPNRIGSLRFGPDVVEDFLLRQNLQLMMCSSKDLEGYEIVVNRKMVKLFSVYKYQDFENVGAVAFIEPNGMISFQILDPEGKKSKLQGFKNWIQRPENPID